MPSDHDRYVYGCLVSERLTLPIIDDLGRLSGPLRKALDDIAIKPRTKKKIDRELLEQTILTLCKKHFIILRCLAELVNRQPESLRNHYLSAMVKDRRLALAFPTTPNHERQAYCAMTGNPA